MRFLFIRHAIAYPYETHEGDDLNRPLTGKGKVRARKAFRGLARIYPSLDLILCSHAVRSIETAEILKKMYKGTRLERNHLLNPGSDATEFLRLLHELDGNLKWVAIVGHEPDLSEIVSYLLLSRASSSRRAEMDAARETDAESATAHIPMELKKASCVDLEMDSQSGWVLRALLPPHVLRKLGED